MASGGPLRREGKRLSKEVENAPSGDGSEGSIPILSSHAIGIIASVVWATNVVFFIWICCLKESKMKLPICVLPSHKKKSILKRGSGDHSLTRADAEKQGTARNVTFTHGPDADLSSLGGIFKQSIRLRGRPGHRGAPFRKSVSFGPEIDITAPLGNIESVPHDCQQDSIGQKLETTSYTAHHTLNNTIKDEYGNGDLDNIMKEKSRLQQDECKEIPIHLTSTLGDDQENKNRVDQRNVRTAVKTSPMLFQKQLPLSVASQFIEKQAHHKKRERNIHSSTITTKQKPSSCRNTFCRVMSSVDKAGILVKVKEPDLNEPRQITHPCKNKHKKYLLPEAAESNGAQVLTKDRPSSSPPPSCKISDEFIQPSSNISAIPSPRFGYNKGDNSSSSESVTNTIHIEKRDAMGNHPTLAATRILNTLKGDAFEISVCTESKKGRYKKHPCKIYYRQRQLSTPKIKPMNETGWSQLATHSIFYEYEPQLYFSNVKKSKNIKGKVGVKKYVNDNQNSKKKEKNRNDLAIAIVRHLCHLTLRRKRKSPSKVGRRAVFLQSNLNKNTNAQHSDIDVREDGACDKKHETMSITSATSIASADAFFSTRTDIADGCEDAPSMVLLVDKTPLQFNPDYTSKDHALKHSDITPQVANWHNLSSPVDDLKFTHALDAVFDVSKGEEPKGRDEVISKKIGEGTLSEEASNSLGDPRHSKRAHMSSNYACLFPSKAAAERIVDGIDSVVMDCMRNAISEETCEVEKYELSGKLPGTSDNHCKLPSSTGHKGKSSADGTVLKLKIHGSKKASAKSTKEDTADGNNEMGSIVNSDTDKEMHSHKPLKSATLSTPNLPSAVDACIKSETVSPTGNRLKSQDVIMGADEPSVVGADDHKLSGHNKKRKRSKSRQRKASKSEDIGAVTERSAVADGDVGNAIETDRTLQMKQSSVDMAPLALDSREIASDEISLPCDTKSGSKSNKHGTRRGRSPRKKQQEIVIPTVELTSILTTSKDDETDESEITKEIYNVNKKRPLVKLKKSVSLSPQGLKQSRALPLGTMQGRKLSLTDNHESDSQGNGSDLLKKSKVKSTKKACKNKRVRIAPVHDDSPSGRRPKPQSVSPEHEPATTPPQNVKQVADEDGDEIQDIQKKIITKPPKKGGMAVSKKVANEIQNGVQDKKAKTGKKERPRNDSQDHAYDFQDSADVLNFENTKTMVELNGEEVTPVHNSPSLTDLSEKTGNIKVIVTKASVIGKAPKQEKEKDLQSAEMGWNGSLVGNVTKQPAERSKAQKSYRKKYKLVKSATTKDRKSKDDTKWKRDTETVDSDYDGVEVTRSENGDEVGKESVLPSQPKKVNLSKKDYKAKDVLHTSESTPKHPIGRRPLLSPRSNYRKQTLTSQEGALAVSTGVNFKQQESDTGSSVDKREIDNGSSVDAPSFGRKDYTALRGTKSGPALGIGKIAQKELDSTAKRVKFARENAMNLAKQARKNLASSTSPNSASLSHMHPSPLQGREECSKLGQIHADEQVSPISCKSTDLDLAAGFKANSSPLRLYTAGRHFRRDTKAVKSAPKLDAKAEDCVCASASLPTNPNPGLLPACDNSMDYNVLNLGLNWMVQGFINRISFLRPSSEHGCTGGTAAGDTAADPQTLPTATTTTASRS